MPPRSASGRRRLSDPGYPPDPGYEPDPRYAPEPSYPANPGYPPDPGYGPDRDYGGDGYGDGYEADRPTGPRYASDARYAPDTTYTPDPGYAPDPRYLPDPGYGPDTAYSDQYGDEPDDVPEPPPPPRAKRPPKPRRPRQPEPPDRGPELPRVPGFAGLRALALFAVLAFEQDIAGGEGGFLGISSVFTLSGFLLATLALAEWSQNGQLFLGRFWERRARRLVPAYLAVLAAVVTLQTTVRVGSVPTFRGDLLAALGFGTNWRLAFPAEGFARSFAELSALRHLWPVAITAQIYLLFPLVFVLFMLVTGRQWRASGALFGLLAAASFGAAWTVANRPGGREVALYGTHTRAGELLVGVVLAYLVLTPAFRRLISRPRVMQVVRSGALVALGILVLLWTQVPIDSPRLFHGVTIANALLTAWVVLAVTLPGPANRLLGVAPLNYLGNISYPAYLVFWPLYLLLDEDRLGLEGPALFGVRVVATLAAGAVLHWVLEIPFRRIKLPRANLAVGFLGCGAAIAVVAFVLPVNPPANISLTIDDGNGPGQLDVVVPEGGGTEAARVLLIGDQTAGSLVGGFEAWNSENSDEQLRIDTHVTAECPLGGPGDLHRLGRTVEPTVECESWRPRLPKMLDAAEYDAIVVLMGTADLGERQIDNSWRHLGEGTYDAWMAEQIDGLADVLAEKKVPVMWVTQPHVRLTGSDSEAWTQHDDNDPHRVDRLNELITSVIRERQGFHLADLDGWLHDQPRGEFNPDVRDGAGFTEDGATQVVTWLGDQIVSTTSS